MKLKSLALISIFLLLSIFGASCLNGNVEDCRPDSHDLLDCNGDKENNWIIWGLLDRSTKK